MRAAAKRLKRLFRQIRLRISRISAEQIDDSLARLSILNNDLFVHSSLSACGFISGGPSTVIGCLSKICSTLILPTHTYCYPESIADQGEVFDPTTSASMVGAISDWFWRQPGVVRSMHPSHSLAAKGINAVEYCHGHELCPTPCGSGTPYEKMIKAGASVVLFGCDLNTYTLFHTTEALAACDYLYYEGSWSLCYRNSAKQAKMIRSMLQYMRVPHRFREMEQELMAEGLLRKTKLGKSWLLGIPNCRSVHEYLTAKLRQNPRYLVNVN